MRGELIDQFTLRWNEKPLLVLIPRKKLYEKMKNMAESY
jgi:hypothetical protein